MPRLVPALLVTGAALAVGAGLIAAGCGRSRTDARAPEGQDASNQAGGASVPSGSGGSGRTEDGGRGGQEASGGSSGFISLGSGGKLEPGTTAQWNCDGAFDGCKGTAMGPFSQNGAGLVLTRDCKVEPERPRSQADCGSGQQLNCDLAIDTKGAQVLVNCECRPSAGEAARCGTCTSRSSGDDVPAECVGGTRICSCMYVSIH
jgi:hypothetical protein